MNKFAIVVIGYNRVHSISRLLNSLSLVDYGSDIVPLIVSIDNSGDDKVEKFIKTYQWPNGKVVTHTYPTRQGLRKHVLNCGDFLEDFDAIAVFEDDVVASPGFYKFMRKAVEFYKDDDRIAGISLYTHLWNVNVGMPFEPSHSQHDTYFLQFAQSWGQIWMKHQWKAFSIWYEENHAPFENQKDIPSKISNWPETSWLKYHIRYCIENDKYFVYPYVGLSTCFSDEGVHTLYRSITTQTPTLHGVKDNYTFASLDDSEAVKYSAFFERILPVKSIDDIESNQICLDLYRSRPIKDERYLITTRLIDARIIRSWGLLLRPIEENILQNVQGDSIMLYDLSKTEKHSRIRKDNTEMQMYKYLFRLGSNQIALIKYVIWSSIHWLKQKMALY